MKPPNLKPRRQVPGIALIFARDKYVPSDRAKLSGATQEPKGGRSRLAGRVPYQDLAYSIGDTVTSGPG